MTIDEAIKIYNTMIFAASLSNLQGTPLNITKEELIEAMGMAIKALEEVQQYRAIGTPEELKAAMKYVYLAKKHGTVGQVIENCVKYEAIGTPEECRSWKEKQNAKKVISFDYNNGTVNYGCPVCKRKIISKIDGNWCGGTFNEYCDRCGQKLDWSDEES